MLNNCENINRSLDLLQEVLERRMSRHFHQGQNEENFTMPDFQIEPEDAPLNHFLLKYTPNMEEYIILFLAFMPHLCPHLIDEVIQKYLPQGGDFPEIGGVKLINHRYLVPTGETAQFLLGGRDLETRLRITNYFSTEHYFHQQSILSLESVKEGEPSMSGRMILSQEILEWLTLGKIHAPSFSQEFPAKLLQTNMTWEDLVLRQATAAFIDDIRIWIVHHQALAQDAVIARKLKRGYRALFYGPPGTGKTLTASLLGKQFHRDVYRIDLSQVVSKFIGETEKNLERIFSKAENKQWILFFDEADSLFGKRSSISSSHDKYANQEVSYLLQRIEDYPGLIILASNFKSNIDQAFLRRFNAILHFPMPDASERQAIWHNNIPASIPIHSEVIFKNYAAKYEFSGSAITNIMQYACLSALSRSGDKCMMHDDILRGIQRELIKEDKLHGDVRQA